MDMCAAIGRWLACALAVGALAAAPARSAVTLSFDAETLNELLPAMAPEEVEVPMGSNTIRVRLTELKVTGFEPASAQSATGRILTSLRLQAPQLNLDLPAQPKIIVSVATEAGANVLMLRFENLLLPVLGTSIDVSTLLPPLRFPAGGAFALQTLKGPVQIDTTVTSVSVGSRYVRFDFDLKPAGGR